MCIRDRQYESGGGPGGDAALQIGKVGVPGIGQNCCCAFGQAIVVVAENDTSRQPRHQPGEAQFESLNGTFRAHRRWFCANVNSSRTSMSASSVPSSSMALIAAGGRERSVNCADMSYRHMARLGLAIHVFNVARLARCGSPALGLSSGRLKAGPEYRARRKKPRLEITSPAVRTFSRRRQS